MMRHCHLACAFIGGQLHHLHHTVDNNIHLKMTRKTATCFVLPVRLRSKRLPDLASGPADSGFGTQFGPQYWALCSLIPLVQTQ
jgi:hypothetical protein